jgi:hypothetical protein
MMGNAPNAVRNYRYYPSKLKSNPQNKRHHSEKSLEEKIRRVQLHGLSEETHWEKTAKTRMGKYLTRVETDFIFNSVDPAKMHTIMDVGAEAGRFSLLAADKNAR